MSEAKFVVMSEAKLVVMSEAKFVVMSEAKFVVLSEAKDLHLVPEYAHTRRSRSALDAVRPCGGPPCRGGR